MAAPKSAGDDTKPKPLGGAANHPDPDQEFAQLLQNVRKYNDDPEAVALLTKAFGFAREKHDVQCRKSGEPYIVHPVAVANILTKLKVDIGSLQAAILHDVVEDTNTPLTEIEREFGPVVASLVDGLTKIGKIKFQSNQEKLAENFRKMVLAMAKDLRVILVKIADRLHNMRTLEFLPPAKRRRIAQETLDIYAPLASRLGIYGFKSELEDLCLRETKNDIYQEIRSKVAAKKAQREAYIDDVKTVLEAELKKYGFKDPIVYGRPKHFYSIYKKMTDRQLQFEDIHDLFAFRIIVESVKDCYEALGIVHSLWKPMPGRFKDYIAMPKANMYQSLHTTVIRPNGEPAEIQIRTREMHNICEYGVAAHWAYKEKQGEAAKGTDLEKFRWLRQIMEWQSELKDPGEFLEAVKVDLFEDEIFVFTPKGDVIQLAVGSTALDFAFAVHTGVGLTTVGAKVNGKITPIKTKLRSGDIIEITTSKTQQPNKDWLHFVTTSKARNKIRSFLRSEQRTKSKSIGLELLNTELANRGMSLEKLTKTGQVEALAKVAKESKLDDILISIGYGKLDSSELLQRAFPDRGPKLSLAEQAKAQEVEAHPTSYSGDKKAAGSGILVGGLDNILVSYGRCCSPLPGEDIIGFITRGKGVTVHRADCPRALDMDPNRRINVSWGDDSAAEGVHHCYLQVTTHDRHGVLADVTSAISSAGANITKAQISVSTNMKGILEFDLTLKNYDQLTAVVQKIESVPDVIQVTRKQMVNRKRKG